MKSSRPVLLVEDDTVDAMAVQRAFRDLQVPNRLDITVNGEEALAYLSDKKNEIPSVILLDLRMPRMGGVELLKILKFDPDLKRIPVIVITTSREEQDIVDSYNLGVAGYILKPVDYPRFLEAMKTITLYWGMTELPPAI